jgi:hypothetical protein
MEAIMAKRISYKSRAIALQAQVEELLSLNEEQACAIEYAQIQVKKLERQIAHLSGQRKQAKLQAEARKATATYVQTGVQFVVLNSKRVVVDSGSHADMQARARKLASDTGTVYTVRRK